MAQYKKEIMQAEISMCVLECPYCHMKFAIFPIQYNHDPDQEYWDKSPRYFMNTVGSGEQFCYFCGKIMGKPEKVDEFEDNKKFWTPQG
jgi:hypothetical protein